VRRECHETPIIVKAIRGFLMKKHLLGTSALVAVGLMAGQANAADKFSLGVGGFIEEWFGYSQKDSDNSAVTNGPKASRDYTGGQFGIMTDAELHMKGTINLDNGIKVTGRMEIEINADKQNMSVDEVWLQISSDNLGMIEIGEQDPITDAIGKGAPSYGIGFSDAKKWLDNTPGTGGDSNLEGIKVVGTSEDQGKINYYTPATWQKATGLQAAFSYMPDLTNNDSEPNVDRNTEAANAWAAGISYSQNLFDIDTNLTYAYYNQSNTSLVNRNAGLLSITGHQMSANFKYAAWEFGGGYVREFEDNRKPVGVNAVTVGEGYAWNVGLGYTIDAWKFSVGHLYVQKQGDMLKPGFSRRTVDMVDASYELGGGISWATSVFHQAQASTDTDQQNQTNGGWGIVTGIVTAF